jgi:hypothetical protein
MGNWIDKLAQLPRKRDGDLISGAVDPVLIPGSSRPGIWYETPYDYLPDFDLLWVCQQASVTGDPHLYAFTVDQALAAPTSAPYITLTLPDNIGPGTPHGVNAFAFAPNGDMWIGFAENQSVSVSYGQHVAKLSASKLLTSGAVTPDFSFPLPTIVGSSAGVSAMRIDSHGNLWASGVATTSRASGIYCFSAASIAAPGTPAPIVTLMQPGLSNSANDLWFDDEGNLWVANGLAKTVNRLSASQLLASDSAIVPDVVLSFPSQTYTGLTTDAVGNLWCGSSAAARAHMFAVDDIQASGSPVPRRSISTSAATVQGKLRFDKSEDLWLQTAQGPIGYAPSDVTASGSPAPRATFTGGGIFTSARVLNFNPQSFV